MLKFSFCTAILAFGALALPSHAAPIVANGDFELDNADFTAFPGYVGQPGNPAQVTDFVGPAGGYGVNPSAGAGAAFRDNGNDNTNVLFIQAGGTTLTQLIPGFIFGHTYTLDFDYNARGCCGGTAGINVTMAGYSTGNVVDPPVGGGNPYHHITLPFLAGPSGTETLAISKYDALPGDSTALYDNFVITEIAAPEPASLGLLGIGGISLLARRRRA